MKTSALKTVADSVKHWYIPLIIGMILILIGMLVFATPLTSYLTLSVMFSISFLASGILQIMFAVSNRDELDSWGWYLGAGILYALIGVLLLGNPAISMSTLPFFVGFYVLFQSANALGWAYDLKSLGVMNWGNIAIAGVLGMVFSFILIWNPLFAGLSLVVWTGLAFLFAGTASIILSLHLRKVKEFPGKLSEELKKRIESIKSEYRESLRH